MKAAHLRGLCSRRYLPRTTQSDHDQPIAPNRLAQRPAPTGPNQTWVTDLTWVRTDEGWLHASGEYRELLKAGGLEPSMSRKGNPYDNAVMESFNATDKRECVGLAEERGGYATRAEATSDFFDYVEKYYNRQRRRHSALGYKSPVDFENQLN